VNISNVKYSPANDPKGRAMILLKTIVSQYEDVTIQLVGNESQKNISELEKMKNIVTQLRKDQKTITENKTEYNNNNVSKSQNIIKS
jgi:hypothetical protein